jgi:hypothetical protein
VADEVICGYLHIEKDSLSTLLDLADRERKNAGSGAGLVDVALDCEMSASHRRRLSYLCRARRACGHNGMPAEIVAPKAMTPIATSTLSRPSCDQ